MSYSRNKRRKRNVQSKNRAIQLMVDGSGKSREYCEQQLMKHIDRELNAPDNLKERTDT